MLLKIGSSGHDRCSIEGVLDGTLLLTYCRGLWVAYPALWSGAPPPPGGLGSSAPRFGSSASQADHGDHGVDGVYSECPLLMVLRIVSSAAGLMTKGAVQGDEETRKVLALRLRRFLQFSLPDPEEQGTQGPRPRLAGGHPCRGGLVWSRANNQTNTMPRTGPVAQTPQYRTADAGRRPLAQQTSNISARRFWAIGCRRWRVKKDEKGKTTALGASDRTHLPRQNGSAANIRGGGGRHRMRRGDGRRTERAAGAARLGNPLIDARASAAAGSVEG